jgi:hypothetical protein
MSGPAELPWGDALLHLQRFSLDSGDLPVDQYTEVFPEYVKMWMQSQSGATELGAAPWRRLRDRFLHWLRGERVETVGPDHTWTVLVHFEPLRYSLYASVQRPPWRILLEDARATPVIAVVTREIQVREIQDWIAAISHLDAAVQQ